MLDPKLIDDISKKVAGSVPLGLQTLQGDVQRNLRSALQSALSRMDLVTREEFDVQKEVLRRTREKLAVLEEHLKVLEKDA